MLNGDVDLFHISFPRETLGIKALVYTLFAFDLFQTGFTTQYSFAVVVTSWGNSAVFANLPWTSFSVPVGAGIVSGIVQIFFAWRIYVIKGRNTFIRIVVCLIVMTALMQSLSAIVNGLRFGFAPQITDQVQLAIGVKIWLIGSFVCDILIAVTMIGIFWQVRRQTPWKATDSIIKKLIYHTVETGAVTAIAAGVELALFLVYPDTFLDEIPAFMLGKLYSNVVLATLNSRSNAASSVSREFGVSMPTTADSVQLRLRSNNQTVNDDFEMDMTRKVQVNTVTQVHVDV
ncbi:hypothetical protein MVEN_01408400 [Mycena venus]|uniref:DUF6534 domain-containing protein n=1 Tax=Mycena venus TaxID=2733690 RepID=A0A8H7CUN5_9AGAR|nr:hypothetical protein MVEN_01408400 [Mycena venus]